VSDGHLSLGKSGEDIAVDFLKDNGYKIIARNYKIKLGEIDIIAEDKGTLCFVEVKTRSSDKFGLPVEAVKKAKQQQISRVALMYLKDKSLFDKKSRFDVVSIINSAETQKIDLIKDAFELSHQYGY
jgi:putative endonuclease